MLITKTEAKEAKEFIEKHREDLNKKLRKIYGLKGEDNADNNSSNKEG